MRLHGLHRRIATCDDYPGITAETVAAICALVANPVHFVAGQGCTYINCTTKQWLHLIPSMAPA
jgi:hypothetical protein